MNARSIPRAAVNTYVKAVRLPLDMTVGRRLLLLGLGPRPLLGCLAVALGGLLTLLLGDLVLQLLALALGLDSVGLELGLLLAPLGLGGLTPRLDLLIGLRVLQPSLAG